MLSETEKLRREQQRTFEKTERERHVAQREALWSVYQQLLTALKEWAAATAANRGRFMADGGASFTIRVEEAFAKWKAIDALRR